MTTTTPAERRAVAEIVHPDRTGYQFRYFAEGCLNKSEERVVLDDGLLRERIAGEIRQNGDQFVVTCGKLHAARLHDRDTVNSFAGYAMSDALWACAVAHVREVERRKADAALRKDAQQLAPETAARVIPYGPEGGTPR